MSTVLSDLRHGLRVLLRTPLFTICTIGALAIGIGATTALFSVVYTLLVKPLPYRDADRLVVMWEHNIPRNRPRNVISPANFLQWRERSQSFESMARVLSESRHADWHRRAARACHDRRHRQPARRARCRSDARPRVRRRRGSGRRDADDGAVARGLVAPVRRRHQRDWAAGHDQRRAGDDHRRDAAGL